MEWLAAAFFASFIIWLLVKSPGFRKFTTVLTVILVAVGSTGWFGWWAWHEYEQKEAQALGNKLVQEKVFELGIVWGASLPPGFSLDGQRPPMNVEIAELWEMLDAADAAGETADARNIMLMIEDAEGSAQTLADEIRRQRGGVPVTDTGPQILEVTNHSNQYTLSDLVIKVTVKDSKGFIHDERVVYFHDEVPPGYRKKFPLAMPKWCDPGCVWNWVFESAEAR